jgi:hypothetical protein
MRSHVPSRDHHGWERCTVPEWVARRERALLTACGCDGEDRVDDVACVVHGRPIRLLPE